MHVSNPQATAQAGSRRLLEPTSTAGGNTVIVASSALQLMNAIEAKHALALGRLHVVLISGLGYRDEDALYREVLAAEDVETVRYLRVEGARANPQDQDGHRCNGLKRWRLRFRQYTDRRRVERLARQLGNVDNLVLGNYLRDGERYMRHLANTMRWRNLYLVDDGTDALKVSSDRRNEGLSSEPLAQDAGHRSWRSRLHRRFVDWDVSSAERVTFFTTYDLRPRPGDTVLRNDYAHFRSLWGRGSSTDVVYFLGQCLIEDGWMTADKYFDYLGRIKMHFAGRKLYYIPHPRESAANIERARVDLGFDVRTFDGPIEIAIGRSGVIPRTLASFFCSALVNCQGIYGNVLEAKAFELQSSDVLVWPEFLEMVYAYFRALGSDRLEVLTP